MIPKRKKLKREIIDLESRYEEQSKKAEKPFEQEQDQGLERSRDDISGGDDLP